MGSQRGSSGVTKSQSAKAASGFGAELGSKISPRKIGRRGAKKKPSKPKSGG